MTSQAFFKYDAFDIHTNSYTPGYNRYRIPGRATIQSAKGTYGNTGISIKHPVKQINVGYNVNIKNNGISPSMMKVPYKIPKRAEKVMRETFLTGNFMRVVDHYPGNGAASMYNQQNWVGIGGVDAKAQNPNARIDVTGQNPNAYIPDAKVGSRWNNVPQAPHNGNRRWNYTLPLQNYNQVGPQNREAVPPQNLPRPPPFYVAPPGGSGGGPPGGSDDANDGGGGGPLRNQLRGVRLRTRQQPSPETSGDDNTVEEALALLRSRPRLPTYLPVNGFEARTNQVVGTDTANIQYPAVSPEVDTQTTQAMAPPSAHSRRRSFRDTGGATGGSPSAPSNPQMTQVKTLNDEFEADKLRLRNAVMKTGTSVVNAAGKVVNALGTGVELTDKTVQGAAPYVGAAVSGTADVLGAVAGVAKAGAIGSLESAKKKMTAIVNEDLDSLPKSLQLTQAAVPTLSETGQSYVSELYQDLSAPTLAASSSTASRYDHLRSRDYDELQFAYIAIVQHLMSTNQQHLVVPQPPAGHITKYAQAIATMFESLGYDMGRNGYPIGGQGPIGGQSSTQNLLEGAARKLMITGGSAQSSPSSSGASTSGASTPTLLDQAKNYNQLSKKELYSLVRQLAAVPEAKGITIADTGAHWAGRLSGANAHQLRKMIKRYLQRNGVALSSAPSRDHVRTAGPR